MIERNFSGNKAMAASDRLEEKEYWLKKLSGDFEKSVFPYDFPKPTTNETKSKNDSKTIPSSFETIQFHLDADTASRILKISKNSDYMIHIILTSATAALLSFYSGNDDIILGTSIYKPSQENNTGLNEENLLNTALPLRIQLDEQMNFKELLIRTKQTMLEAVNNQNYPLEMLLVHLDLGIPNEYQDFPLFDVAVLLENIQEKRHILRTHPHVVFSFLKNLETISCTLEYDSFRYSSTSAHQLFNHMCRLLDVLLQNLESPISQIDILSDEEKNKLLIDFNSWNSSETHLTDGTNLAKTLPEWFEDRVGKTPDNIAIIGPSILSTGINDSPGEMIRLTYGELNSRAGAIARELIEMGVKPNSIVAITAERSIEMIIGLLGILKSGGAYLPIDPKFPQERIRYILNDSAAKVGIRVDNRSGIECVETEGGIVKRDVPESSEGNGLCASDLAYVIYTSGTTGTPKGVLIQHDGVVNYIRWRLDAYRYSESDVTLQPLSFIFDGFGSNFYSALLSGGKLVLIPENRSFDIHYIKEIMSTFCVTNTSLVPGIYNTLLEISDVGDLEHLRFIVLAGDKASEDLIKLSCAKFPGTQLINEYGPTETTVTASANLELNAQNPRIIGKPIANFGIYILDKYQRVLPLGIAGELLIGGIGVGRGYLNRPELTEEKFVDSLRGVRTFFCYGLTGMSPSCGDSDCSKNFCFNDESETKSFGPTFFKRLAAGGILYKTGDLARWLPNGNIEFIGRVDHQVKIRGFRIEPGEIEDKLKRHPAIKDAVVLVKGNTAEDSYLCGYTLKKPGQDIQPTGNDLKIFLASLLPEYMIPARIYILDSFPVTPSGKVDRKLLANMTKIGEGADENDNLDYTPPRNSNEKEFVRIMAEVLHLDEHKIGIDSNFFDMGGHSLKATMLVSKIHKTFHVHFPLNKIFETPTIRCLSEYLSQLTENRFKSLTSTEEKEYYPLSSAQKRLYFLYQIAPEDFHYNMPQILPLGEDIQKDRIERAFQKLIARHESLRTSFHIIDETPMQHIHPHLPFQLQYIELNEATPAHIIKSFVQPFDLSRAPLLRATLVRTVDQNHWLLFDMHHIVTDGSSQEILTKEYAALYNDENTPLPELRITYKDYALWQSSRENRDAIEKQSDYWLNEFSDEIPVLELPYDFRRPALQSFEGASLHFFLNRQESAALKQLCRKQQTTLFMLLLSFFDILLSRLSGQEDIVVGTVTAGRTHDDLHHIIGMFVNTLALRNFPSGENSFLTFLAEVKEKTLRAFENQDFQFEDIVERLNVRKEANRNPVFDVMFSLHNQSETHYQGEIFETPSQVASELPHVAKFDISFASTEFKNDIHCLIEYSTKLFKKETIERIAIYFKHIVSAIIEQPDRLLSSIDILSPEEKDQLLYQFNQLPVDYPSHKTIHSLLEETTLKTPDAIALQASSLMDLNPNGILNTSKHIQYLSYRELNEQADRIATELVRKGVQPGDIVAIQIERSLEMMIGIFGILKTGSAYLPIDPTFPQDRIDYMLKDSNAKTVLTVTDDNFKNNRDFDNNRNFENNRPKHLQANDGASAVQPAYIIYTSGTTGKPKGVVIPHRAVINRLVWIAETYRFNKSDIVLQKANYTFDVSVCELFRWIIPGARCCILPNGDEKNPPAIRDFMEKHCVTSSDFVPSLLRVFLEYIDDTEHRKPFPALRWVFTGAEIVSPQLIRTFHEKIGKSGKDRILTRIFNCYGPTEATVDITHYDCADISGLTVLPIGKPIQNTQILILSKNMQLQPVGIPGELLIGGECLANGYLNRPELTAEKFVDALRGVRTFLEKGSDTSKNFSLENETKSFCPTFFKKLAAGGIPETSGGILYKTGDLARWLPDGNIEFVGRIDFQVKIRGYRIEPEEVQNMILKHSTVKEALVTTTENYSGEKFLCAYIVPNDPPSAVPYDIVRLKTDLSEVLPAYMIPTFFIPLDSFPVNTSGKINKRALPEPQFDSIEGGTGEPIILPTNPTEETIAAIWAQVLNLKKEKIGIDSNFFELGGHSLNASSMLLKLHRQLNVRIPLAEIFVKPTIRQLETYIRDTHRDSIDPIEPAEGKEYYPLSSAQKRLYVLQQLNPSSTHYNMPTVVGLEGKIDLNRMTYAFKTLVKRHDGFRTSFNQVDEVPVQWIHPEVILDMEVLEAPTPELAAKAVKDFVRPFPLAQAPLLRVGIANTGPGEFLLMTDMHHIISDGISTDIFIREFILLYDGIELSPLPLQYKDFTLWQINERQNSVYQKSEDYWLKQFEGQIPQLNLPTDYPRPNVISFKGDRYFFKAGVELTRKLKESVSRTGTTLHQYTLAAYTLLLSRYSRQEDIIVGCPATGRTHDDLQSVIGMFVNMLAMRNRPENGKTFRQFLEEVKLTALNAFENQEYPFDELVIKLKLHGEAGSNPLFSAAFAFNNIDNSMKTSQTPGQMSELRIIPYPVENQVSIFDITLRINETIDDLSMHIEYKTVLFKPSTIEKYAKRLIEILEQTVDNHDIPLKDINIAHDLLTLKTDHIVEAEKDFMF